MQGPPPPPGTKGKALAIVKDIINYRILFRRFEKEEHLQPEAPEQSQAQAQTQAPAQAEEGELKPEAVSILLLHISAVFSHEPQKNTELRKPKFKKEYRTSLFGRTVPAAIIASACSHRRSATASVFAAQRD
jgi:hypothetical protein